jgi:hypothetical protein
MHSLSIALATISLLMIAYQDYRSRAVHWIYFPLLALAGIVLNLTELHSPGRLLGYTGFNFVFLCLQFVALKAWFFIRYKDRERIIDHKIGAGDLLFLTAACFFFSPLNFIVFYLSSLIFSILVHATKTLSDKPFGRSVPLAGLQATFFILFIYIPLFLNYSLFNDDLLILKLIKP